MIDGLNIGQNFRKNLLPISLSPRSRRPAHQHQPPRPDEPEVHGDNGPHFEGEAIIEGGGAAGVGAGGWACHGVVSYCEAAVRASVSGFVALAYHLRIEASSLGFREQGSECRV